MVYYSILHYSIPYIFILLLLLIVIIIIVLDLRGDRGSPTRTACRMSVYFTDTGALTVTHFSEFCAITPILLQRWQLLSSAELMIKCASYECIICVLINK